jgi:hypothetical protein
VLPGQILHRRRRGHHEQPTGGGAVDLDLDGSTDRRPWLDARSGVITLQRRPRLIGREPRIRTAVGPALTIVTRVARKTAVTSPPTVTDASAKSPVRPLESAGTTTDTADASAARNRCACHR